jgi:hypothetical protein
LISKGKIVNGPVSFTIGNQGLTRRL